MMMFQIECYCCCCSVGSSLAVLTPKNNGSSYPEIWQLIELFSKVQFATEIEMLMLMGKKLYY